MRALLIAACLMVTACATLTPEQRAQAHAVIDQEYAARNLTAAQRDAAHEAVDSGAGFDWEGLGLAGLSVLLALVGAPAIVRIQRGPATPKATAPKVQAKARR